jgi:hypothetical protein
VNNGSIETGLRVDLSGQVNGQDVANPEPATYLMLGSGLLALGLIRRQRSAAR